MKVNEYGSEHEKTVAMFQCAAEPGWVLSFLGKHWQSC